MLGGFGAPVWAGSSGCPEQRESWGVWAIQLCSTVTEMFVFRRKQIESCCLYKLSRWTGAAGNRLGFPSRARG